MRRVRAHRDEWIVAGSWLAMATTAVATRPLWATWAPYLPACPLRAWTGLPCPMCGATRASLALATGDVAAALGWNPAVTLVVLAVFAGAIVAPLWLAFGWPRPRLLPAPWPVAARLAAGGLLAADWVYVVMRLGIAR